mmetsp:Transcript_8516/g.28477  ORF Transcript_8516/g.28477 Transcript_8516/m.28477 type:complete len:227 (-) Transcript_8516:84-764(-)
MSPHSRFLRISPWRCLTKMMKRKRRTTTTTNRKGSSSRFTSNSPTRFSQTLCLKSRTTWWTTRTRFWSSAKGRKSTGCRVRTYASRSCGARRTRRVEKKATSLRRKRNAPSRFSTFSPRPRFPTKTRNWRRRKWNSSRTPWRWTTKSGQLSGTKSSRTRFRGSPATRTRTRTTSTTRTRTTTRTTRTRALRTRTRTRVGTKRRPRRSARMARNRLSASSSKFEDCV